jgi:hypothetical protein
MIPSGALDRRWAPADDRAYYVKGYRKFPRLISRKSQGEGGRALSAKGVRRGSAEQRQPPRRDRKGQGRRRLQGPAGFGPPPQTRSSATAATTYYRAGKDRSPPGQLGRAQAVTMIVENRPGASTAIGTEAAARAVPDGKTLLVITPPFVINPQLRKLNYDPLTSFEPICNLVRSPLLIVVNSASPYRTLGDLLSAARAKSGDLTLAGAGPATTLHLAFEMLKRAANVNMTFVPYPGDAPAVQTSAGRRTS